MKTRYIYSMILSAALAFAGCDSTAPTGPYDNISLDKSYVFIPEEGGSTEVKLKATEAWAFLTDDTWPEVVTEDKEGNPATAPSWLSAASQMSGEAGEYTISFSADATNDGRELELRIKAGSNVQILRVRQGSMTVETATCAEVIAGPDSKTYRVKGTCLSIYNTEYGNWYLDDGTGTITIYGTLDADGAAKNFLSLGLEQGDIVEVQGPKLTYETVTELVDVTVLSITKSLLKIESAPEEYIQKEGGSLELVLSFKGEGLYPRVPEEYRSWISIAEVSIKEGVPSKLEQNPADTATVTINILPNEEGDRDGSVEFTSGSSKVSFDFVQKGNILQVSIAEFNAASEGPAFYNLTGVVTKIDNAENGNFHIRDFSGETYVYKLSGFADKGIKVDDIVTVVGQYGVFKEEVELVSPTLESVYPVTEVTTTKFAAMENSKTVFYKVTAVLDEIVSDMWGNSYITDGTTRIYVYGIYPGVYPGLKPYGESRQYYLETAGIEVGDTVTLIGYKDTYEDKIELCNGIYVSHEKASE
ncbi:MAG: BACON domain-containing protein [Candidatus Cryptobacteroides sp.]